MSDKPSSSNHQSNTFNKNKLDEGSKKRSDMFRPSKSGGTPNYGTNNTLELLEKIPSGIVETNLDDVLTAVKDVDNLCDYTRCKAKTTLMGQNCDYCLKRFCFKHGLPEVHGCGEAAKKNERKQFLHPKPAKTIKQEEDLEKARRTLQTKLKDMQIRRMQKSSGGADVNSKKGGNRKNKGK